MIKSDQKIVSDVRIICSTSQNLSLLVQEGKFSKALFQELKSTILFMPSLLALAEEEVQTLVDGFTQQESKSEALQHIFALTHKEKKMILYNRPSSLQDLKSRIQQFVAKKSKKTLIDDKTEFNPGHNTTDPDLILAARLGKEALKDPQIMKILWNKFKNQNKISTFLGVNRSSVNRRCKEYNLL
jgi:DNA-binding NtrC family response regulator